MSNMRKGDVKPYTEYRQSRFFKEAGNWYFQTREGSTEGPFQDRCDAEHRLEMHLTIFKDLQLDIFEPGINPLAAGLKLEPIQMQWR